MEADFGFIGLGNMGFQMAGNTRKHMTASATLHIFDVVPEACERFIKKFGSFGPISIAHTSKEVAEKSQTVISMVPNGGNAQEVYLDPQNGVIAATEQIDRLMLECSTIEVKVSQDIGKSVMDAGQGVYVDAPVSGGTAGAAAGTLSFMVGFPPMTGADPLRRRVQDVLNFMGAPERVTFCGSLGAGLVCKTVNNYIGLSNIVTAAEGMAFGIKHGVDKMTLYKSIKGSSGDSWVMDNAQPVPGIHAKSASTNGFRQTFAPRLCVKDVSLALEAAKDSGIEVSMGEAALKVFQRTNDDPRTTVSSPFSRRNLSET
ncbi:hypothetical protein RBB50_008107 [Rhinocladiella similis]